MLTGTKKSIREIDAWLDKSVYGYLIIEDDQAYLKTDDDLITLDDRYSVKIAKGYEYINVSYDDLLSTVCDSGWPLYAGKDALVK